MDFQPLFNLNGLVPSNKSISPSPPRSMFISLDEQLSAFGSQTFWFSEGISLGSLLQTMQLGEMADPSNALLSSLEESEVYPGSSHLSPVSSYFSQESNSLKIEVGTSSPNSQPLDLNLGEFYERRQVSTVNMLMKYVEPLTRDDLFQDSMESCSGEEMYNLDPADVLDMDMPISSVSTVASTPEIKNVEVIPVLTSTALVKYPIESRGNEKVGNLNVTDNLKIASTKSAPVPAPTRIIASATKPKAKKEQLAEKCEDFSSRRLKRSLICEICEKTFLNNSSLKQHMSFHRPQRPYQCDYPACEKSYKTRSELNRHVIVHIGQKNFKCMKCGKTFLRKQYLKTHLLRHNEGLTWQCGLCAKIFVSEEDLEKHKISYHKNGKRSSHSGGGHSSGLLAIEYHNGNEGSLEA